MEKSLDINPPVIINEVLRWKSEYYELVRSTLQYNFTEEKVYRQYTIMEKVSGLFFQAEAPPMQIEIDFSEFRQVYPKFQKETVFVSLQEQEDTAAKEHVLWQMGNMRSIWRE